MAIYTGDDTGNSFSGVKNDVNIFDTKGGDDTVSGGYLYDQIDLGAGDDYVSSFDGADVISTGTGRDTVAAGAGDDQIFSYDGLGAVDSRDSRFGSGVIQGCLHGGGSIGNSARFE